MMACGPATMPPIFTSNEWTSNDMDSMGCCAIWIFRHHIFFCLVELFVRILICSTWFQAHQNSLEKKIYFILIIFIWKLSTNRWLFSLSLHSFDCVEIMLLWIFCFVLFSFRLNRNSISRYRFAVIPIQRTYGAHSAL